jgi:uncharacterized zinc-type alcohol dehydrogenase-like protein
VSRIGAAVDPERLRVGQRVAVGAIAGSCMSCEFCLSGRQQLCAARDDTVLRGHRGGFASSVRAGDWRFAYPVPDAIESQHAGPMLCAGATVFAPFLRHGIRPIDRVGIVGIGGLGHLAIQFANAWGCEVTAISSSASKKDEAHQLGAHHFIATRDTDDLARAAGTFDFLLSTVSADLPWNDYLAALKPQGVLSMVGVPEKVIGLAPMALLPSEKVVSGGVQASRQETLQMLDFAARTGVRPRIETYPMTEINQALARVRSGQARYRAVVAA